MGEFMWHVFRPSIQLGSLGEKVRLPTEISTAKMGAMLTPAEMCRAHAETLQRIGTLLGLPAGSDLHVKCEERIRELVAGWNAKMRAPRVGRPPFDRGL